MGDLKVADSTKSEKPLSLRIADKTHSSEVNDIVFDRNKFKNGDLSLEQAKAFLDKIQDKLGKDSPEYKEIASLLSGYQGEKSEKGSRVC